MTWKELEQLQRKVGLRLESAEDEMLKGDEYREVACGSAKLGAHW